MNKRRLLKLADLLAADAKNQTGVQFSMSTWGRIHDKRSPVSCGTQACAMGLAALSKAFEKDGLGYQVRDGSLSFTWKGECVGGFKAATKLFGLDPADAAKLFAPSNRRGAINSGAEAELRKARQIRRLVAQA